ncbi:MAG: hypothetical protein DRH23_08775 [Deltaproteobacteria bacterium]|nr:MAG: hypothetical protein DRH23_08775 [Deltaproteobacteria bacterium]
MVEEVPDRVVRCPRARGKDQPHVGKYLCVSEALPVDLSPNQVRNDVVARLFAARLYDRLKICGQFRIRRNGTGMVLGEP